MSKVLALLFTKKATANTEAFSSREPPANSSSDTDMLPITSTRPTGWRRITSLPSFCYDACIAVSRSINEERLRLAILTTSMVGLVFAIICLTILLSPSEPRRPLVKRGLTGGRSYWDDMMVFILLGGLGLALVCGITFSWYTERKMVGPKYPRLDNKGRVFIKEPKKSKWSGRL